MIEVTEKIEAYLDGESGEIPFAVGEKIGKVFDLYTGTKPLCRLI